MTLHAKVKYADFKRRIVGALKRNKNRASKDKYDDLIETEKEYRRLVGLTARDYRDKRWGPGAREMDARWQNWVDKLEKEIRAYLEDEGDWGKVASIDSGNINDLASKGSGFREFAFAIHFRMHRDSERPVFAKQIDEKIWGASFEKEFQEPVFEDFAVSELPASYPVHLKLDDSYQPGRSEFRKVKEMLLSSSRENAGTTAVVQGFGGYGKTAVAEEICLDEHVRQAFPGGIYWLQFGLAQSEIRSGDSRNYTLTEAVDSMLVRQYPPTIEPILNPQTNVTLLTSFLDKLPEGPKLLVADDLWSYSQSSWIEHLPKNVSVLATTRTQNINPAFGVTLKIERLSDEDSYGLLSFGLCSLSGNNRNKLRKISKFFRGWSLLLQLANSTARERHKNGWAWAKILSELEQFTQLEDIQGWDDEFVHDDIPSKRRKLIGYSLRATLDALPDEVFRNSALSLAIFPEDTDIPFAVVKEYWAEVSSNVLGGPPVKSIKANTILDALYRLSFFRNYDAKSQTLQIHDVLLAYCQQSHTESELRILHQTAANLVKKHCVYGGGLETAECHYGWNYLLYHLEGANNHEEANLVRTDYFWLFQKLRHHGYRGLLASFNLEPCLGNMQLEMPTDDLKLQLPHIKRFPEHLDASARELAGAIILARRAIERRPSSFAHQIVGRLADSSDARLTECVRAARSEPGFWPIPKAPYLQRNPRNEEILEAEFPVRYLRGEDRGIIKIMFAEDGKTAVSASSCGVIKLWNTDDGSEVSVTKLDINSVCRIQSSRKLDLLLCTGPDLSSQLLSLPNMQSVTIPFCQHGYRRSVCALSNSTRKVLVNDVEAQEATICDIAEREDALKLKKIASPICFARFSEDEKHLMIATLCGDVRVSDTTTGDELFAWRVNKDDGRIVSASFDKSGEKLVTATSKGIVRTHSIRTGCELGPAIESRGHKIHEVVFDPAGARVIIQSPHGSSVWDTSIGADCTPISAFLFESMQSYARKGPFQRATNQVASKHLAKSQWVTFHNRRKIPFLRKPVSNHNEFACIAFDKSGERVLTASMAGRLHILDLAKEEELEMLYFDSEICSVQICENRIAVGLNDGNVAFFCM